MWFFIAVLLLVLKVLISFFLNLFCYAPKYQSKLYLRPTWQ